MSSVQLSMLSCMGVTTMLLSVILFALAVVALLYGPSIVREALSKKPTKRKRWRGLK